MNLELLRGLVSGKVTTLIGVVMVVLLATRWNTMSREEIVALIISALIHGVARDPKLKAEGGPKDELSQEDTELF